MFSGEPSVPKLGHEKWLAEDVRGGTEIGHIPISHSFLVFRVRNFFQEVAIKLQQFIDCWKRKRLLFIWACETRLQDVPHCPIDVWGSTHLAFVVRPLTVASHWCDEQSVILILAAEPDRPDRKSTRL